MSLQSVPPVVLTSIVVFIGTYNLAVYLRRRERHEHLTFFLTCMAIGFYDVCCACLYSAPSWSAGAVWQRMQLMATALLCAVVPWFMLDFFGELLAPTHAVKAGTAAASTVFVLAAAAVAINPGGLLWPEAVPLVKVTRLPFGLTVVYNEVALGAGADLINAFALAVAVVLTFTTLRAFIRARRRGIASLAVVSFLILACLLSDAFIARGSLHFVYTSEYALMGLAVLISQSLSRQVADTDLAKDALRLSEARYRSIFQHSGVSLWAQDISQVRALLSDLAAAGIRDLETYLRDNPDIVRQAIHSMRVIDVNDATLRLYEAERKEDLLGPLDRTLDEQALPSFVHTILAIARGDHGTYEGESTARTLRGNLRNVMISTYIPHSSDEDTRMLVSVTDITARKRAEEKLRSFIEQSTEPISLVDESGSVAEFNPSAERLFGISRLQALGRRATDLIAQYTPAEEWTPEVAEGLELQYRRALTEGTAEILDRPLEGVLRRPDGTRRDFVQFLFPIRTSLGFMLGSIFHDTTETRRTEEALRLSEERLLQAQKMEAIGTLAGGIAHDFNNLLTGILGHASLVRDELPANSALAADIEAIEASAERASELAGQILTFARQDPRIELHTVSPAVVAGEVVRFLQRTVDKSVSIETRFSVEPLAILANPGQLHQAILNLCINACEAMPDGGTLLVETGREAREAVQGEDRAAARMFIAVTDTGSGISEDTRQRIFDPFFTTKEQGRGLGLPMVYGIVRGHGGEILIQSEPGRGTTFRILLPLTKETGVSHLPGTCLAGGGHETILVIDDEMTVRRVLTRVLQRAGYEVLVAEDGASGLSLFQERKGCVNLVILDVSMPGLGGVEVQERLAALDPGVKVILSSGYSEDERISRLLARGVQRFLRKPYKVNEVLAAVRDVLDA